jgi:hypothetical protein
MYTSFKPLFQLIFPMAMASIPIEWTPWNIYRFFWYVKILEWNTSQCALWGISFFRVVVRNDLGAIPPPFPPRLVSLFTELLELIDITPRFTSRFAAPT